MIKTRYFTLNCFVLDWYIVTIFSKKYRFIETRAQES